VRAGSTYRFVNIVSLNVGDEFAQPNPLPKIICIALLVAVASVPFADLAIPTMTLTAFVTVVTFLFLSHVIHL